MQLVGAEAPDEQRAGGDPAFAAVITVRARRDEPVAPLLDFLEPCWGCARCRGPCQARNAYWYRSTTRRHYAG